MKVGQNLGKDGKIAAVCRPAGQSGRSREGRTGAAARAPRGCEFRTGFRSLRADRSRARPRVCRGASASYDLRLGFGPHREPPKTKNPSDSAPGELSLVVPGKQVSPARCQRVLLGEKKKARTPGGVRTKFGVGRSPRALSHSHLLGALADWRAKCFPTLLTAASDALGLIAGPSRPFQAQDLSSEASLPGSVTICRWFARRTGAGTPVRNNFAPAPLNTRTATAGSGALASCDGSDLLPLRLHSTYSWVTRCSRRPKLGRLAGVAIPRRSTLRFARCALAGCASGALGRHCKAS